MLKPTAVLEHDTLSVGGIQETKTQQLQSHYNWPLIGLRGLGWGAPGRGSQVSRKMAFPISLNSWEGLETLPKMKIYCYLSFSPRASKTSSEQRGGISTGPGATVPLWESFGKSCREGTGGTHIRSLCLSLLQIHTHTYSLQLAEVGPSYLLEKDESDCHLPFLLFWITKRSQLFPGLPWWGGEDGGREEIPASVATGESFKMGAAYELFSLSGKHLCNCWWPWLPTQGPKKGEDEGMARQPSPLTETFGVEGRGLPCS